MRPAVPLICQLIDEHRERFGVVPVCRALSAHGIQIAPRTYWARQASGPGKRALWDMTVTEILAGIYEPDVNGRRPPESMYGTVKMWGYLQRQGIEVAKCTIERLKRAHGWRGVTRARRPSRHHGRRREHPAEAVVTHPVRDLVIKAGRIVAPDGALVG